MPRIKVESGKVVNKGLLKAMGTLEVSSFYKLMVGYRYIMQFQKLFR